MTEVQDLARFVSTATFDRLSVDARDQLKIRVLDTLGVAIGALDAEPVVAVRGLIDDLGGTPVATMIGGGKTSIDRAAFMNVTLSRYLDFMDAYLAKGETCHPSDNLGAVLAASESVGGSGAEFLTALGIAYQVQSRLSDVAPVRAKGFDHTVQGAYASAAAVAKALRLTPEQTANAIAISGTANNALRVTRTSNLSNWKGLAYPNTAKEGTFAALLASRGITGPELVFEGNKGFKESIAGPFDIDWSTEDLERVRLSIVKKHNAEIHSQSALDAALDIRSWEGFSATRIEKVRLRTFDVAYSIIGGGDEGDKHSIRTKEEADHSLPYLLAAALLDGEVNPAQFEPERIVADDIQRLLARVEVVPDADFSARFPAEMPAALDVTLTDGTVLNSVQSSYQGFHTNPMSWAVARAKFDALASPFAGRELRDEIADLVSEFELRPVATLTNALARVSRTRLTQPARQQTTNRKVA